LESQLWEAAHGKHDMFQKQGEQARYLSEKCQGWAISYAVACLKKNIPLREWEAMYGERLIQKIEEQQL